MDLEDLAGGSRVFVDATLFVYHFSGLSPSCRRLLDRIEAGDVNGITSVTAIAEANHRLLMLEAVSAGLVPSGAVARKLRDKPDVLKQLHIADEQVARIPLMGFKTVGVDVRTLSRARELREKYGLMVNDSLIAAAAIDSGADMIATADRDFDRVEELDVCAPGDLATTAAGAS